MRALDRPGGGDQGGSKRDIIDVAGREQKYARPALGIGQGMDFRRAPAARATLVFDGPGQGEGEYDFPIRGDYEVAVKAVVDFIETRRDLDASRIGLWGVSLGGYYAPRAAAFERRVKACIALAGPYDWAEAWEGLPELTKDAFRVRSHCKTMEEAKRHATTLSLKGVAERISCPLFIMLGKLDRIIPRRHAERLAREAKGPVELLVIEDGNHVANNRTYRWRTQTADWMAERLRA